jgi:proline racemase
MKRSSVGIVTLADHAALGQVGPTQRLRMTGLNTIFVDPRDPYAHGFQLP